MSFGISLLSANGVTYDANTPGITFVTMIPISAGASGSMPFPQLAGFTLRWTRFVVSASAFGLPEVTVSYTLGYPVLSYAPGPSPTGSFAAVNLLVYAQ